LSVTVQQSAQSLGEDRVIVCQQDSWKHHRVTVAETTRLLLDESTPDLATDM